MLSPEEVFRKNSEKQNSPISASVSWNMEEDTQEMQIAWFEEVNKLPLAIRFGLCLREVQERIEKINQAFGFEKDLGKMGETSRLVREIFTRSLKEAELLTRIREKLNLSGEKRNIFYEETKKTALLALSLGQKDFDSEFERLPIAKLFNVYPETRVQKINWLPIYQGEEKTPIPANLENWLRDYWSETGSKKHSALERSKYLFESENAKRLNSTERENLAILLKSADENFPLVLNKEEKKVNLEESRKIDENWLASLVFFLGKERELIQQKTVFKQQEVPMKTFPRFAPPEVIKKEKLPAGTRNILDLSDFN